MTENQLLKLKQDAADTIKDIDTDKMTERSFVKLLACLAFLGRGCNSPTETTQTEINAKTINVEVVEQPAVDYVENSLIDNKKQESLLAFIQYMDEKGLEQTTNDRYHGTKAEQALKKMLSIDCEILEIMLQSADEREKSLIRETYKKMSKL